MAENKKSFILYSDLIHTVSKLPNDKAGELFKHILAYVNDENPVSEDLIIQIAFEPVKLQLKRDLKKWESYIEKQSENGKKGGRPPKAEETQITQPFFDKPKKADTVTVNDTVTDTVTEREYTRPIEFLKQKIEIDLETLAMQSGMSAEDFYFCLNQWSLKCEEAGFEYTDEEKDLKKLRAGFEKWLNSWLKKERAAPKQGTGRKQGAMDLIEIGRLAKNLIVDDGN